MKADDDDDNELDTVGEFDIPPPKIEGNEDEDKEGDAKDEEEQYNSNDEDNSIAGDIDIECCSRRHGPGRMGHYCGSSTYQ